jgi:hypothetical protein
VYVLPAGTRQRLLSEAKDFEKSVEAEKAVDFVVKDNEPGDIGIQAILKDANGKSQLDVFRAEVIRSVYVKNKSSSPFFTLDKNGKGSNTASKADQALLTKLGLV